MGFIEDLFGTSTGIATGALLIGTGVGVTMLTGNIEDKKLKLLPQVGGLALAGMGAYKIYQSSTNPLYKATEGDVFGLTQTKPNGSDVPRATYSYPFTVRVSNQNPTRKLIWVGCSLYHTTTEEIFDLPVQSITLGIGEEKEVSFSKIIEGSHAEPYQVRFSAWGPKAPIQTDVIGQDVFRLADTGWYSFTVKGPFDFP